MTNEDVWKELIRAFGLSIDIREGISSPEVEEVLCPWYQEALRLLQAPNPVISIETDRSPVMRSPLAFVARMDHGRKRIVLNGWFLDELNFPGVAAEFLTFHELFHELLRMAGGKDAGALLEKLGMKEEAAADFFAAYSLQRRQS